jgi:hypothetical protein
MGTKNKSNATCPPVPRDWYLSTRRLLAFVQERLSDMPPFEMREVEHSLCETDKHMRLLLGEGSRSGSLTGVATRSRFGCVGAIQKKSLVLAWALLCAIWDSQAKESRDIVTV